MPHDIDGTVEREWLDLSLAQQSVWLDAKVSGASVYQLGGWARVAAPLDEQAVRQSVQLLMARHDALRLRVDDELPRQWLDSSSEPPVSMHDLQVPPGESDTAAFQHYVELAFHTAMPLGDHPLFRMELLRVGPSLHYVLWRFHHLIADSLSVAITLHHWFEAYDALTSSSPRELAPPSSYLKTVASDAAYLESSAYHQNLAYWAARFEPLPPPLIADMAHRAGEEELAVPSAGWMLEGDLFHGFEQAARAAGSSTQRALFALMAVTLGRRYGQTEVVSGVALHRRDLANRYTLGMMAGVIAVRCDFDPFWTLAECLQTFSEQLDADLRHQRLPVDVLARALGLSGTGRTGLFEVAMSYLPAARGDGAASPLEGLPVTIGTVETREASPISLHMTELPAGAGMAVRVAVNPEFLDAGEAATLSSLLRSAVERFVTSPESCFEDLPLLSEAELGLVTASWNETDAEFPVGTLDGLFEDQARRTPEAIAVLGSDGEELTYQELDARSSRLARRLVAGGVQMERVVGVRMVRSAETIVALLAILKAGGAYLPLDPAYPTDRLDYTIADADAMMVLEADDVTEAWGASETELPPLPIHTDAGRLAYVIYTSGTTGLPKGVAMEHAAAVNLAFARRACHDPLGVGDRVLAAISVGFDVSIGQLLLPLLSGATVVIAGELKTMDAVEFWQLLEDRQVTHINSVPSFFESVLEAAPPTVSLKRLMLGGEALSGTLVKRIHRALPGVEIVNMYGPTESCIDATYHVALVDDETAPVLPIGQPLSNYRAYVLDPFLNPVGIGVPGELYLGGAGLARGYLNAPELTEERFVPDPFSEIAGARLYRTGDRARWRADGHIEFLGRGDAQVKIRGFRVEPGEIAAVLLGHEAVAQAVVVPLATDPGKPGGALRLVAYVVPKASATLLETAALRAWLAERLPDYMVPSAFIALAAMPLNRNGKFDAAALPLPELEGGAHVAPRTPAEGTVARLFAEVLGLAGCGATDHFFELGGHSLLAASLVSKLRAHGWTVPLRAIFETPTVEMLARRMEASLRGRAKPETIILQDRPSELPLSFSQERIWFVDRLQGDSSYNIPVAFRLRGIFHQAAAVQAIHRIIDRHEALRTRIVLRDGKPVQEVQTALTLPLKYIDLRNLAEEVQAAALRESMTALVTHRFDLAEHLPIQMQLIALDEEHHVLAMVVHHIAFDGWSAGVFLEEFAALYAAAVHEGAVELPPLAMHYADYALWQRGQDYTADLQFWLEELEGAPATLDLSGSGLSAGATAAERGSRALPIRFDKELHAQLQKLAQERGVSLFMVLHTVFALLLARLSGQDDVVLGTVVANRGRQEFEPMIGCFVNTLPLRTRFAAGESFAALLNRVGSADLAAFAHQELPFEQLVAALHPERSLEHAPIFQVLLVLQNAPLRATELPGLSLEPLPIAAAAVKFDLTLSLLEDGQELAGTFEYAADRFSEEGVATLARGLERMLRAAVADPSREALRLEILDPAERILVVDRWNQTQQTFAAGTLDGLFSAQARQTPDTVAVVGLMGEELTYAALDAQSTRLARQLVADGLSPGQVVGVRMQRSTETILSLLGILKAGGVYLPLDPAYPTERLEYMAADAGGTRILESLDGLTLDGKDAAELPPSSDPERVAYIIYTSGTTGLPKGVAVSHRAAVNLAFARRAAHDPLGVGDRVLAAISVGFDVSIGQLLLPLLAGATVVVAGELKTMGAAEFWTLIAHNKVTHINSVPSFLESVLDAAPQAGKLALKRLMLGGEALTGALVSRLWQALPGVEVVNMYGPTETCIDATFHVAVEADRHSLVLPIGRPLPNYRAYVLDGRMEPVGTGVTGELYLGGAGLAQGYVHATALTAERFVADPFSSAPGARLYRTGDRARWRADEAIEFLGRIDNQVKIRGFRVEPGEVEAQLRLQPGVREAAVVPDTVGGSTRLLGYYTEQAGSATIGPDVLRTALASVLPDYMVPVAFIRLDELPLSLNGKLDRKALPAPDQDAFAIRDYEAPVGEIERRMAALWAELLHVDRVGRHDNFFELGGHSLLAVTLIERMRQQQLPGEVRDLFTTPTVSALSALAEDSQGSFAAHSPVPENGIPSGCVAITPEMLSLLGPGRSLTQSQLDRIVAAVPGGAPNVQDIYPLAPLQEGILFQYQMTEQGDPYLTPFLLAFATRPLVDRFVQALQQVVQRHDVLRTAMAWTGLEAPLQVVLRQVAVPVDEITLDNSEPDTAAELLKRFDPRSFRLDLAKAPLLRVVIAEDRANDRWLLLLLTHHLVLDHTSLEILLHELQVLVADPEAPLPIPIPYRNFISHIVAEGDAMEGHEAFFRRLLSDVEEPTAPYGLLDTQANAGRISESRLLLPPNLAHDLRTRARTLSVTPASLFHLAWASVLGHLAGKTDVVFGTVLFGRMRSASGADRVVGMFINTLPIRIQLDGRGVEESARQTHRLLAEMLAHEHAPLALAQRVSAVPSSVPLFSSLFNYRYSAPDGDDGGWPGVSMVHAAERTNYPLAMAVDDTGTSFALTALAQPGADPAQACRYLEHALAELLERLKSAPETPVEAIQPMPPAERAIVVEQGNQTHAEFPSETLHGLFQQQVKQTPTAIAVVGVDGTEMTYAALDDQSTLLARHLRRELPIAATEAVVGVHMERSVETIVSLLAILKAGAVYLPLDPSYPSTRLEYMIANAGAVHVLDSLPTYQNAPPPSGDALPATDPSQLAYMIYTSGTTGLPKGVAVPHSAAVNLAFARRAAHDPLGPGDRVLAAISVGFDVSIGQLLLPLLSGATVVIAGDIKTMGSTAFWQLLQERRITQINSVPSFFESVLDAVPPSASLRLKRLMLGGEALSGALVARLHRALPGVEIVNMYGPTETCIDATFHIATEADHALTTLPIGRPLPNYRAYVLDSHREPTGVGVAGELYLGGAGLAHGYVQAAELTAERFVADPFSVIPGARLYRTGDRARWNAHGEVEFLGRVDAQVKIRGFRVEPGEVETHLCRVEAIREVAVVPHTIHGRTHLIAYYTVAAMAEPEVQDLREALAASLPDYMIPSAFIRLDRLPLSVNGKLDRKALPAPMDDVLAKRAYDPPLGAMEETMAALWASVLKLEKVGRHDNFFELGGESLSAMRLANTMSEAFGQTVPVRSLFQHPTVAALAVQLSSTAGPGRSRNLVPLWAEGSKPPIYFVHASSGHVFRYMALARALGPDQPVYGLQATGLEEGEVATGSVEEIATSYVDAIQTEQPDGPYHLLGYSSGGLLAYEMAQQFKQRGQEVAFLALLDTSLPNPWAERIATEQMVVLDMASSLGIADLLDHTALLPSLPGLVEMARQANRLPADFQTIHVERMADVFRNTVRTCPDYVPRVWDGPLLLVRATRRPQEAGPLPDWSHLVRGAMQMVDLDCSHPNLIAPEMAPVVAETLTSALTSRHRLVHA